jgi:molybdate transport system permease protein
MALFLALPILGLMLSSAPNDIAHSLSKPEAQAAMRLSLETTLIATAASIIFGVPLAYLIARRRFFGRSLLDALIDIPILLPPAVAGIALLLIFGREGFVGQYLRRLGIEIPFTPAAVCLAQLFVAAPFFIRAAAIGFAGADIEMEQAAQIDGAGSWRMFRDLHLPLAWPAVLSGAVTAWARALGEFGATIIFAGNFPGRTQTMPLAIYLGFEFDFNVAAALSVVLLVASLILLLLARRLVSLADPVSSAA